MECALSRHLKKRCAFDKKERPNAFTAGERVAHRCGEPLVRCGNERREESIELNKRLFMRGSHGRCTLEYNGPPVRCRLARLSCCFDCRDILVRAKRAHRALRPSGPDRIPRA